MDFLRLTVWAPSETVQSWLEETVIDRVWADLFEGWRDLGPRKRVASTWRAADRINVLEFRGADFCQVEVTGDPCTDLGNEGARSMIDDLGRRTRVKASRIDLAWDGFPVLPSVVRDAVKAGNLNSRAVTQVPGDPACWQFLESGSETMYLGRRKSDVMARVYNWRGPTRFELEVKGDTAAGTVGFLSSIDAGAWGRHAMAYVRKWCDFVARGDDERADRCALLPWWSKFVGDAARSSAPKLVRESSWTPTAVGSADGMVQRYARHLEAMKRAFGSEWLLSRIETHARRAWGEADDQRVRDLRAFLGSGLARVPDREQGPPVPF